MQLLKHKKKIQTKSKILLTQFMCELLSFSLNSLPPATFISAAGTKLHVNLVQGAAAARRSYRLL